MVLTVDGLMGAPPELLALVPFALAAGVDLYLTLLLLGLATHTGWWASLPGALGDLSSPAILMIVGGFYVLETVAERWPSAALVWNAFHAIIRPLSGALLTLLLLDGHRVEVAFGGAVLAAALASGAHAVRTGGGVLFWLDAAERPSRLLISALEDVGVMGAVVLTLDRPGWALGLSIVLILATVRVAGSQVRAFGFAVRLAWSRAWTTLGKPRWDAPESFPDWVRRALEGDPMAPGGGLRGAVAGAHRVPGARLFVTGWVVVRGDTPIFLYRRGRRTRRVDLGTLNVESVGQSRFYRRVALRGTAPCNLYFGIGGPGTESLRAEFAYG